MTSPAQQPISSAFTAASSCDEVLADIDLAGITMVVTGGYSGLGLETTRAFSTRGAQVIVPARRADSARHALAGLPRVSIAPVDLTDPSAIRSFADAIRSAVRQLDVVIAAAGVMATPERHVGPGWEYHLTANHLGHFLLVSELFGLLRAATGSRVISYSSAGHMASDIRWADPHLRTGYDKWAAYGQSKTANALFATALDTIGAPDGVRAFSLHPGEIATPLQRDLSQAETVALGWVNAAGEPLGDLKTTSQGAATGAWAATARQLDGKGGLYLEDCNIASIAASGSAMSEGGVREYAIDPHSADRLWELSLAATGATPLR